MENPKCNPGFGADSPLRSTGPQTTHFHTVPISPTVQIYGNSRLHFAMVLCLHHGNHCIERKLRESRTQKCNPWFGAEGPLRCTGPLTTRFHSALYKTDIANLRKLWATFRHGTVFAPKQSLIVKEATGMENPKM